MTQIIARNLTKEFRQASRAPGMTGAIRQLVAPRYTVKRAVDTIDLSIEKGETVAYVGPNGAGKSTTIKMLTGILVPSSGTVEVEGMIPWKKRRENAGKIGAVFGQRTQLWWDIPVGESFALLKDIYEIPRVIYKRNLDMFTELLALDEFSHLSARKISLGQRMRADLAAALLHNPKILYLDEPTIGLDIAVKLRIRRFIREVNENLNTTVMLTTHDLDDIEDICRRLVIIDRGKIIYDGPLQAVKDVFARERTIHFEVKDSLEDVEGCLRSVEGIRSVSRRESGFSVGIDRFKVTAGEVVSRVMSLGEINDIRIDEPKIEQVIRRVYDGDLKFPSMAGSLD